MTIISLLSIGCAVLNVGLCVYNFRRLQKIRRLEDVMFDLTLKSLLYWKFLAICGIFPNKKVSVESSVVVEDVE